MRFSISKYIVSDVCYATFIVLFPEKNYVSFILSLSSSSTLLFPKKNSHLSLHLFDPFPCLNQLDIQQRWMKQKHMFTCKYWQCLSCAQHKCAIASILLQPIVINIIQSHDCKRLTIPWVEWTENCTVLKKSMRYSNW